MQEQHLGGLGIIRRGEYIQYYPLKFETDLDYRNLCEHIFSSLDNKFDECKIKIENSLQESIQHYLDKKKDASDITPPPKECLFDDTKVLVDFERGIQIGMIPGCMREYYERAQAFEDEHAVEYSIYGEPFTTKKASVLLTPLHIRFNEENDSWLQAILYVFENKMGILKLELPLKNVALEYFKDIDLDEHIKSIIGGCFAETELEGILFSSVHSLYVQRMCTDKVTSVLVGDPLTHLAIVDCDGLPDHVENIPDEVQKDLYEIITAPIEDREYNSTIEDAKTYIATHSWGAHMTKYVTSSRGRCLSILSKTVYDNRKEDYASDNGLKTLTDEQVEDVNSVMVQSLRINVEYVLVVMALKRMNMEYIFDAKKHSGMNVDDVQLEYNRNLMFISELQNVVMGTVYDQLEAFEQMMPHYMNKRLLEDRMNAIDRIRETESTRQKERLQDFIALAGVILAAIFGLPAIRDTIAILRSVFSFIQSDIPYATIDNVSFLGWIAILFVLVLVYFRKKRSP